MVGRDSAWEKLQRGVAIALRQITKHLIVCPVLFDNVDDVLERWIFRRALSRLGPVVRPRDTLRELRQLAQLHVCGERSDRAVQLSECVIGTIGLQLSARLTEMRVGAR